MKHRIQLDWSRLLGFDQVEREQRLESPQLTKAGIKPMTVVPEGQALSARSGFKPVAAPALGHRIGAKVGGKPLNAPALRIGAGIGAKPGFKPAL